MQVGQMGTIPHSKGSSRIFIPNLVLNTSAAKHER